MKNITLILLFGLFAMFTLPIQDISFDQDSEITSIVDNYDTSGDIATIDGNGHIFTEASREVVLTAPAATTTIDDIQPLKTVVPDLILDREYLSWCCSGKSPTIAMNEKTNQDPTATISDDRLPLETVVPDLILDRQYLSWCCSKNLNLNSVSYVDQTILYRSDGNSHGNRSGIFRVS